jgi:hypothetical protein
MQILLDWLYGVEWYNEFELLIVKNMKEVFIWSEGGKPRNHSAKIADLGVDNQNIDLTNTNQVCWRHSHNGHRRFAY